MGSNPQFPADLFTFTRKIINRKLHFFCSVRENKTIYDTEKKIWIHSKVVIHGNETGN